VQQGGGQCISPYGGAFLRNQNWTIPFGNDCTFEISLTLDFSVRSSHTSPIDSAVRRPFPKIFQFVHFFLRDFRKRFQYEKNLNWILCVVPERCSAALGMQSRTIPDKDITASSSFDVNNVGPQRARWVPAFAHHCWTWSNYNLFARVTTVLWFWPLAPLFHPPTKAAVVEYQRIPYVEPPPRRFSFFFLSQITSGSSIMMQYAIRLNLVSTS